jgi:D-amino peptidase
MGHRGGVPMGRSKWVLGLFVALLAGPALGQQSRALRVFISVDMEGIAGIVTSSQLGPDGFDYPISRKLMTGEANAAVEGALAAGATKITVSDGHGNGLSILPDQLNQKASLIRSWPRPTGMLEGVEAGYDAVICIGYHASSNSPNAVLAHTFSGRYFEVKFNGKHATEAMAVAAVAGHYAVPVVLVAGDNVIVDEVHRDIDPNIVGVIVKRAIGMHSAESLSPEAAETLIREKTTEALKRLSTFRPFVLTDPVTLDLTLKNPLNAEILSFLPNVQREDGATIRFIGKDIVEVEKFLQVVSDYNPNQ